MRNLSVLLSCLLLACALGLVTSQQRSRLLRTEIEQQITRQAELESRWDELQIQQTQLAKASLIDSKARKQVKLRVREPERTMHLMFDDETRLAAHDATLRWRAASLGEVSGK